MKLAVIISFMMSFTAGLFLNACASTSVKPSLHEMTASETPSWDMVSLKGWDEALREAYQSGYYDWGNQFPRAKAKKREFYDLEFKEFSKANASLRIFKAYPEDSMTVQFFACNGYTQSFARAGKVWSPKEFVPPHAPPTLVFCEYVAVSKTGKKVSLPTLSLLDTFWDQQIVTDLKGYKVSEDGQTLTLVDDEGGELGVFTRKAAQ